MSNVPMSDRPRLQLRKTDCESYGIEPGDIIAVIIERNPGDADQRGYVLVGERVVQTKRRVSIPADVADARDMGDEAVGVLALNTGIEATD